jgi:hypothetical protein
MLVVVFVFLVFGPDYGFPAQLYKYRDAEGLWHFSDLPPETSHPVETRQLQVDRTPHKVLLRQRGSQHMPAFSAHNTYHGPVEVEFLLEQWRNVSTSVPLPVRLTVPALGERQVVTLWPTHQGTPWSYRFKYRYVLGNPAAVHKPTKPYRAPFARGQSYLISQGFNGTYRHHTPDSQYAIDIIMPEGTPIHAARGGVVMDVQRDFNTVGTDREKYSHRANVIRILHDDGTTGVYAHLKFESNRVSPGMVVSEGHVIAESGNTGFSSRPHLHFVIHKSAGMQMTSVPFQFADQDGTGVTPQAGTWLTAY